ncbi:helix-turn-helix domain-containing protein [Halalkalicoccus sp. NIPERK01]|uniref:helix-turn-helix domain-containing protein n=1 Tax=Halalkalicoccus sp. NIPERK01 TaxID=3053469 RepID=UPI00256EDF2E|nr:helix-turn-helix domain-containing protein [Halalkalicoccus sp. NIPERK01]MDL5360642.1 helix-turn-helix domain-containing protein [Halalkalicoccus sp. NIPERK01]
MDPQTDQPRPVAALPEELRSAGAKLVYLYLAVENEATIDELQAILGMRKVTLYPLLQTLTRNGLVEKVDTRYVCTETRNT